MPEPAADPAPDPAPTPAPASESARRRPGGGWASAARPSAARLGQARPSQARLSAAHPTRSAGRAYFAAQATAATAWWVLVLTSETVRRATLGDLDPGLVALIALLDIPLFVVGSALAALGLRWAVWVVVPWTGIVAALMAAYATATQTAGWGAVLMIAALACGIVAGLLVLLDRIPGEALLMGPLKIRTARPGGRGVRYLSATAAQIVVFWGFFLALLPLIIAWLEDRWRLRLQPPAAVDAALGLNLSFTGASAGAVAVAGIALLLAASALGIWSGATMAALGEGTPLPSATANRLVIAGPYRIVRNPMAVSAIAQGVAVGLILGSWLVVIYALCGALIWNWAVRPHEEADLAARFGSEFVAYREQVSCWWPKGWRKRISGRRAPAAPHLAGQRAESHGSARGSTAR